MIWIWFFLFFFFFFVVLFFFIVRCCCHRICCHNPLPWIDSHAFVIEAHKSISIRTLIYVSIRMTVFGHIFIDLLHSVLFKLISIVAQWKSYIRSKMFVNNGSFLYQFFSLYFPLLTLDFFFVFTISSIQLSLIKIKIDIKSFIFFLVIRTHTERQNRKCLYILNGIYSTDVMFPACFNALSDTHTHHTPNT